MRWWESDPPPNLMVGSSTPSHYSRGADFQVRGVIIGRINICFQRSKGCMVFTSNFWLNNSYTAGFGLFACFREPASPAQQPARHPPAGGGDTSTICVCVCVLVVFLSFFLAIFDFCWKCFGNDKFIGLPPIFPQGLQNIFGSVRANLLILLKNMHFVDQKWPTNFRSFPMCIVWDLADGDACEKLLKTTLNFFWDDSKLFCVFSHHKILQSCQLLDRRGSPSLRASHISLQGCLLFLLYSIIYGIYSTNILWSWEGRSLILSPTSKMLALSPKTPDINLGMKPRRECQTIWFPFFFLHIST